MAKIKDILANISNVKVGNGLRGILLIISLVNMALSAAGKSDSCGLQRDLHRRQRRVLGARRHIGYWKK